MECLAPQKKSLSDRLRTCSAIIVFFVKLTAPAGKVLVAFSESKIYPSN